jgi:hypothetical protein
MHNAPAFCARRSASSLERKGSLANTISWEAKGCQSGEDGYCCCLARVLFQREGMRDEVRDEEASD